MEKNSGVLSVIRKLSETGKLTYGSEKTMKEVRSGNITKIFISSTPDPKAKKFFERHKIEIISSNTSSKDLGIACKKPFSISIVGVHREESN